MKKIQLLDCTLRDGGYVNNWEFGYEGIKSVIRNLEKSGAEVLELGFMRNESYSPDRSIYNSTKQISELIGEKQDNTIYAALIEMANYFPLDMLDECNDDGPDAIRYSFWKRKMDEAYAYAKGVSEKGYKLCVQPTRVEQYSEKDFAKMITRFNELNPYALYIVDTFGLLRKKDLIKYAEIADEYLGKNVILGYHAHNNMQQAFCNATAFVEMNLDRMIQLDGSVYGMGRGAGNLNMEMIMNYLNENCDKEYNVESIIKCWDDVVKEEYEKEKWGYDLSYFLAAKMELNPNYPHYYLKNKDLAVTDILKIFSSIEGEDKYLYNDEKAEQYYKNILG